MMNRISVLILAILLPVLALSSCASNNPNPDTTDINAPPNETLSTINDSNYQVMMQEQSMRASEMDAAHAHGGGRR